MDKRAKIFIGIIVVLVLGVIATAVIRSGSTASTGPGEYDQFATCLADQGAMFYGTFWCKFCGEQKKMFGSSQKLIPYTECSTADGRAQNQVCTEKEIKSYPTWEFADGSRLTGVVSFEQLAEKTSCALPGEGIEVTEDTVGDESIEPSELLE